MSPSNEVQNQLITPLDLISVDIRAIRYRMIEFRQIEPYSSGLENAFNNLNSALESIDDSQKDLTKWTS